MQYKPTASLYLERKKAKTDGRFPVKITIYCNPDKKRYGTAIDLSEQEWDKLNSPRLKDEALKEAKIKLEAIKLKAEKVLDKLSPFSFVAFEQEFFKNAKSATDTTLKTWFEAHVTEAKDEGRVGTGISYNSTFNSLDEFKRNLTLTDVSVELLKKYEAWMIGKGNSISTVGIYLRQLRTIINKGIEAGLIRQQDYPFGKGKYVIPGTRNVKKALPNDILKKLLDFKPEDEAQKHALDYWTFSYLCNGMNFTDIALLTPANLSGENFLSFIRAKTKNTKKHDQHPIKVALHERAKAIIQHRKASVGCPYLFPILDGGLSPIQIKYRIQSFIKRVNENMAAIAKKLEIEQPLRTYEARHSFATKLKRAGASTEMISESLGHASFLTTALYMGSFEEETKHEITNMLTKF